jgi:tetratricopeptide (TPR) repeat protein
MIKVSFISSLSFLLVFSSCASNKEKSVQQTIQDPKRTEEVQKPIIKQPDRTDMIHQILEDPQQHFSQGNLQEAIDGYTEALDMYPGEPLVLEDYIRTLEEIKISADRDYKAENYQQAEEYYSVLLKNFPRFQIFEESLSFDSIYLNVRIKACLMFLKEIQAREAISAGDYEKAIDVFNEAIQTYPERDSFQKDLIETCIDMHERAKKALEREDFVLAGKMYFLLLKEYAFLAKLDPSLPFSKESLEDGIKDCRTQLTRKGLIEYREGNLKEAISIWENLLQFDPENAEIRKAIDNAKEQLKKIKKKG